MLVQEDKTIRLLKEKILVKDLLAKQTLSQELDNMLEYNSPLAEVVTRDTTLYYLKFKTFSKIGITSKTIQERFNGYNLYYRILDSTLLHSIEARYLEKKLLGLVDRQSIHFSENHPMVKRGGHTECFKHDSRKTFVDLLSSVHDFRVKKKVNNTVNQIDFGAIYEILSI